MKNVSRRRLRSKRALYLSDVITIYGNGLTCWVFGETETASEAVIETEVEVEVEVGVEVEVEEEAVVVTIPSQRHRLLIQKCHPTAQPSNLRLGHIKKLFAGIAI